MLLSQLVEINEKGSIASSVNFGMIDNPEINLHLCEQFIFNYDHRKPDLSTVGILDALRRSYHSPNQPNIHLMIQDYGKGKSHFAVVIANYFKNSFNSPEVQGILYQVEIATVNKNKGITEGLKLYKQNQQHNHLVICLSGDRGGDIRKQFLQSLVKSLVAEGITDSLAQNTCSEPLHYLETLDEDDRAKAEKYLRSIDYSHGDVNSIIRQLQDNNPSIIPTVKELAYHITGFTPDFSANIDVEAILQDILTNYCTGENKQFQGVLILFDELNYYLQSWSVDQIGAGGTALQNITNICDNYKGKIALISFAQFHPSRAIGISANTIQSYQKIATRLAPKDSTYDNPASSLELVLGNLLIQKEDSPHCGEFYSRWFDSLVREARTAYEQRIKIYREQGWTQEEFYRRLGKGCFPLHPLTAYLLCNLDFTQDRTAIQFIKGYVKKFIQDEPVEKVGQLNYIYPIALVDTFVENFSNESVYTHYKKALGLVAGSDDTDELTVLKALFLFYACGEKLTKSDREEHQEILAALTGLPKSRLKVSLDKLEKNRDIIYYRPETKLYRFWEGISPTGIEEEIEDKIKNQSTSIYDVVVHCQSKINLYLGNQTITATQFVKDNKLVGEDWQFEYKIYSIDRLIKALESEQTLKNIKERGVLAYVLAETQEDLQEFRRNVDSYLSKSAIKNQIAIAIPSEETGDLARVILKIKTLEQKDAAEKQFFGSAYKQLLQRWQDQVNKQLERLLKSCTYHCVGLEKIPASEQGKAQRVVSVLLQEKFLFVPPVDEIDKLRSDHKTGSNIVSLVAKQLFTDSLAPQSLPDQSYRTVIDTIYVNRWGLLKKTSQKYIIQVPTNEKIRAAWDKISEITELDGILQKEIKLENIWKLLSASPYGYSEYNFTILLAGWLVYHRKEVVVEGSERIPKGTKSSIRKTQPLQNWANPDTDILQKPVAFVSDWIIKGKAKLIRRQKAEMPMLPGTRINYEEAQHYLAAVAVFLETNEPEAVEVAEINKNRESVSAGVEQIDNWLQPVVEVETLAAEIPLEVLLQLYPRLMERPPAINLIPDAISVQPTQQQRDRQTQALQNVSQKITEFIETISKRSEFLSTEEACNAYKLEIQGTINQLNPITNLPSYLLDILRNAIRVADLKLIEIREQAQVKNCLSQIQSLNKSLNDDATQQDYISIRAGIETLARSIPNSSQDAVEVKQILQNLDQRYRELSQQIEIWEERSSGVTSKSQILDLFEEISRQDRRFTEEASKQRLTALQEQLKQELLKIQSRDDTEKLVRAELSSAQYKLQRIRDLSLDKLSEAFQVYQELINSSLPSAEQAVALEEYHKKLDGFKAQGRTVITEKFVRIYNRIPHRLEDCESLQEQLQRSQKILTDAEDFAEIRTNIEQALQNLELQHQELQRHLEEQQKQAEDKQIMLEIYKYQPANKINTIHLGEQAISEIENLINSLNNPEELTVEIEQILKSIRDKLTVHRQSLSSINNRLSIVDSLTDLSRISTEYAKLELVFKGSADYPAYQDLQQQIQLLSDDITQIQNLEARFQQCDDISSCKDVLEITSRVISNEQLIFHDLDRFRGRILNLEETVRKKIQEFISELQEFEYNLEYLTTVRDAQRFQEELLRKSSQYINSDVEEQYEAIKLELKRLIELLQIAESIHTNTLDSCQEKLNRLREWQNITEGLSVNLRDRMESLCAEITARKAEIRQQQKIAAQNWLQQLAHQLAQINILLDDEEKLLTANNILQQIQNQKHLYFDLLEPVDQQSLELIENQCLEEQSKNKANQILLLFRQLTRLQQQNLYERLGKYLSDETED
ncbi:hypothetical protein H6G36_27855 [Anabaena minutissima FACHB-250]|nr:hypothetical protein [Anabaena minutissima FACHB-250]